jgi:hypothetical protein
VTATRLGRRRADRSADLDQRTHDLDCHADAARRADSGGASCWMTWSQAPHRRRAGRGNGRGPRDGAGLDRRSTRRSTRPPHSLTATSMRRSSCSRGHPYVTRPSGATTYDHVFGPAASRQAPHGGRLRRRRRHFGEWASRSGSPLVREAVGVRADRRAIVTIGLQENGWGLVSRRPEPKVVQRHLRRHCTGSLL